MNIPTGKIEEKHITFVEQQPFDRVKQLMQGDFDGYVVATVEGISGLEEGILLIKSNEVVGALFDAMRINKQMYGVKALRLVLNILKARKGVFDVNRLSKHQVDLVMVFNEKIRIPKTLDVALFSKLEPSEYREDIVSEALSVDLQATDSRRNVLRKFGLGSI